MTTKHAIVWFRQDLRLHDNPALSYALSQNYSIIPIYILDDHNSADWKMGAASRWWLHQSLSSLNKTLSSRLFFFLDNPIDLIPQLLKKFEATALFWNRCYEPWQVARDQTIKDLFKNNNIEVKSFNASLLWEPWDALKEDKTPYKVFTPYYRKGCLGKPDPTPPIPIPETIIYSKVENNTQLEDLKLMPEINWYQEISQVWTPGEYSASEQFKKFLDRGLNGYKIDRNRPDLEKVSRLSPHIHFGEISPRKLWHDTRSFAIAHKLETDMDCFCSELGWREFSHSLLYYNPQLPTKPLQKKFDHYPWENNDAALLAWQKGLTGIPIVDAGMRQLWKTGWMHNRVRMIVASFLVKNLRIHWQHGENWFWDTLVDADLANNAASWQWVAGCGADAAPYFRIFNPVTQGEKFDPDGNYIRAYVPELQNMPTDYIHRPWEAPSHILNKAGATNYPAPIVDLAKSRLEALDGYKLIKGDSA